MQDNYVINNLIKIKTFAGISFWFVEPGYAEQVFLPEPAEQEGLTLLRQVDELWEYKATNSLLEYLGVQVELVNTSAGILGFHSLWDHNEDEGGCSSLYWATPSEAEAVLYVGLLKDDDWHRSYWVKQFCIEEEKVAVVSVKEMRGSGKFWNWEINQPPRLFSLEKLTYPEPGLNLKGIEIISMPGKYDEVKRERPNIQLCAFEYEVTPQVLMAFASTRKIFTTPTGDVTIYAVSDSWSPALEDENIYFWATAPDGRVLGSYSRWIGDRDDATYWMRSMLKKYSVEPVVELVV
jgi:hypothetical protein